RSTGYAPSKTQKLTKISLFLPTAENPEQALRRSEDKNVRRFTDIKPFIFNYHLFICRQSLPLRPRIFHF
ncbi:MAG: hypothetical protein ACKOCH_07960, partial [Bacteroidota bacterium]